MFIMNMFKKTPTLPRQAAVIGWLMLFSVLFASLAILSSCIREDNPINPTPAAETLTLRANGNPCSVYTFNYPSVNSKGEKIELSALLMAWTPADKEVTDSIESIHIVSHATITSDRERPTTTDPSNSLEQSMYSLLLGREYKEVYGTGTADFVGRSIIILPDYEGYGITSDRIHPYLSERLTARQVVDGVQYGLKLYKQTLSSDVELLPIKSDCCSFSSGFSQGGAVALAVQRYIEENNLDEELQFKGSLCADGPYDLVATIRYYLDDNGDSKGSSTAHRKGVTTMPVVIPFIFQGLCASSDYLKDYSVADLLSQQMIDTGILDWLSSKKYTTTEISLMWAQQLQNGLDANGRHYTPEQMAELFEYPGDGKFWGHLKTMLTPECYAYLSNPDNFTTVPTKAANAAEALHLALVENAVTTGWTPKHRIYFFHSVNDMVVPYNNYLAFAAAQPDGFGKTYLVDNTSAEGDHVDAGTAFFVALSYIKALCPVFNWLNAGE